MAYIGQNLDRFSIVEKLDVITPATATGAGPYNLTKASVAFTPASADTIVVSINGVTQYGNFTVSGSTITFSGALTDADTCDFIYQMGTGLISTPADGTVNIAKLSATGTKDATTFLRGDNTFATVSGDISSVVAGTNLSGGGISGDVTINLADASTSAKGAASFSSDNFAASSGAVTIKDLGVATGEIQDNAITLAKMASGTDGNIISYDASGNPVAVATGNDGQVLTSTGAGSPPVFETPAVGGKVLQVVHASEGQVRSSTVQNWASISGLTLDITPSSTSSKILVICNFTLSSGNHGVVRIKRDSTVIGGGITASGNRQNVSMYMNANNNSARVQSMVHLDSPNKSSATTYFAEWYNNTNSPPIYLNRTPNDTDAVYGSRGLSTITLMEIAG